MELREGLNKINVVGVLKEKDLKFYEKDGEKSIGGTLTVETGENQEIKVKVFSKEFKKGGGENKIFTGLVTVKNDFISMAEDIENADKIKINGAKFRGNDFFVGGKTIENVEISANFINRLKSDDVFEPKATFETEIFYAGIKPETDNDGEETGRTLVSGYIVGYNSSLIPIKFTTTKEAGDYIGSNFEPKLTGTVAGEIISTVERITKTKEGFGKTRTEEFIKTNKEYMITGGDDQLEEDDPKAYKVKDIKEALKEREILLENLKNKENKISKDKKQERKDADDDFPF